MSVVGDPLMELDGLALADRAALHGEAKLTVWMTSPAGTSVRAVRAGGSETEPEDRHLELFCMAKPIVALAVLLRSHDLGIDVAAPLRAHLRGLVDVDAEVTVATLLSHGCRLAGVPAVAWMTAPVVERDRLLATPQGPAGTSCYSEVQAGALLARLWPSLAGESLEATLRWAAEGWVGDPTALCFGGEEAAAIDSTEVAPLWVAQGGRSVPMLHLLAPEYRRRQSAAFSALARPCSVHGVFVAAAPFLLELEQQRLAGQLPRGVERPVVHDEVHRREVGFFSGFFRTDGGSDRRFASARESTYIAKMGVGLGFAAVRPASGTVVSCCATVAGFDQGWPAFELSELADLVLSHNAVSAL